jgi:hypothetical protein
VAAREVSDCAHHLVGAASQDMPASERIRSARRLRLLTLEILDRTVIAELLAGATMDEVAEALLLDPETARGRYSDALELWAHPQDAEQRGPGEAGDPDVAGTAAGIDRWWARHQDPSDPRSSGDLTPVMGLLDKP